LIILCVRNTQKINCLCC